MWSSFQENQEIVEKGIEGVKWLGSYGGITFTLAFLFLSLRLAFTYSVEARLKTFKHLAYTSAASLVYYTAWQIAPRLNKIFFYPMLGLNSFDRPLYLIRWVASFGGIIFTLSFMLAGFYLAFFGSSPIHRNRAYYGLVSTSIGMFLFYSAWMFAPLISTKGLAEQALDDKPIFIIELIGSLGGVLFTIAFLFASLKLAFYSTNDKPQYISITLIFLGGLLFYSAYQFAPTIANLLLPPDCEGGNC